MHALLQQQGGRNIQQLLFVPESFPTNILIITKNDVGKQTTVNTLTAYTQFLHRMHHH